MNIWYKIHEAVTSKTSKILNMFSHSLTHVIPVYFVFVVLFFSARLIT